MTDERHPVDLIVDEFVAELRDGRQPTMESYVARYPQHQALLESILPSIELVERAAKRVDVSTMGTVPFLPQQATAPKLLGDFEILRLIGRGGMGVVYEAVQHSLNRQVALKIVNSGPESSTKQQIRFRREAEAAASLHHTNIVPVFGSGEDQGYLYFAMQLIDGVPLNEVIDWLRRFRKMQPAGRSTEDPDETEVEVKTVEVSSNAPTMKRNKCSAADAAQSLTDRSTDGLTSLDRHDPFYRNVARTIADVAAALQYAHHQGMVHRDIKPSNLLLDREGTIWVTDFGLARRDDLEGMTQTGEVIGTLRYMAPEQFRGEADPRTDLFSLGLTLYELLTMEPAFPQAKSRAVKPDSTTPIRDVKSWNPHVPGDLRTITMKACSLEPSDRYQTAAALEEDLRRFLDDRPILARRISSLESLWRWSRRNPLLASLTTLVLGLLASMVVMLSVWNQQATDDLRRIQTENRRAEQNLLEKTSALQLAQQEQTRAEKNLQLAVDAFDAVIQNISARGAESWNWSEVDDEDLLEFPEASLTGADVVLLETLLKFFDRFSAENSQQLLEQTAFARRRVGDLQKHLGRYVDAEASYQQAANAYRELGNQEPEKTTWIIAQAEVLLEQQWLASQRRELARALKYYEQARTLIEGNSVARNSLEGRFALAKVLSTFASFSPRQFRDLRPRPPVESVRKQGTINEEAIQLLTGLSHEHPEVVAYRVTLARALKNDMRLASGLQDPDRAESALQEAVKIMEGLIQQYPDIPTYQFELAEILCTNLAPRPRDQGRFLRAKELAEELVREHPQNHKYKSLLASVLSRMALMHWHSNRVESGERILNEVIEMQRALADDVPEMVAYQVQYLQSLRMLASWQKSQKRLDESKQTLGTAVKAAEKFAAQGKSRNLIKELLQVLGTELGRPANRQ